MGYGKTIILISALFAVSCAPEKQPDVSIIPRPVEIIKGNGTFRITRHTRILINSDDPAVRKVATNFAARLRLLTGFPVKVGPYEGHKEVSSIIFNFDPSLAGELGMEGYLLKTGPRLAEITAAWPSGLFYGTQTFFQLLPAEVFSAGKPAGEVEWEVAGVTVRDKPAFSWRGMHLDVSRHFFPVDFIKRYIDLIAMHKMNVFHWHLTDDNGWRLEIEKYPGLTGTAAWSVDREDKHWREREPQQPGEKATYGGYYSREDVKEIIRYANERFVTIIPEIEMPGHTREVFSAYPEYSCSGDTLPVIPGSYWPISDIFCAGKEETFAFLTDVLGEVASLFPSEYIHIGGDEVTKTRWEQCPRCQARMKAEGLKSVEELQSYFIRRIETILKDKGKRLIGWDEILDGGLAPDATVMSWRGYDGGIEAAKQGHDVIMCPTSHCYFDYYQADKELEPEAIGGYLPLKKVYSFRPVPPSLSPEEARHIMGGQGNVWTEYIATPSHAEYMALPRMTALSEVLWTREEYLDWYDFRQRLRVQFERFDALGASYSHGSFRVEAVPAMGADGFYYVTLETQAFSDEIRYTADGSMLGIHALLFDRPLRVNGKTTLAAAAFKDGAVKGKPVVLTIDPSLSTGKKLTYARPSSFKYPGTGDHTLNDGLLATTDYQDGRWQGFEGTDLEVIIDLGEEKIMTEFGLNALQDQKRWIFLPTAVEFSFSADGQDFAGGQTVTHSTALYTDTAIIHTFMVQSGQPVRSRYVRVSARNIRECPPWHPGKGSRSWIFLDEITVR